MYYAVRRTQFLELPLVVCIPLNLTLISYVSEYSVSILRTQFHRIHQLSYSLDHEISSS